MALRIAINGYGRIGRCFLRALHESPLAQAMEIVAINEPADLESIAYLTRFDSTHGPFPGRVSMDGSALCIDGRCIPVSHATEPEAVDWAGLGVDLVVECSGQYAYRDQLQRFLDAGCPRLLLSHPGHAAQDVDATVVLGVNDDLLTGQERLVSAASCTTNALVPVLTLLDQAYGVEQVMMTTLHSVMNDQPLIDGFHHTDLRRTRSAMQSIIPVATGLARGVERLMPQLLGRVHAKAMRVPVLNVSAIDVFASLTHPASATDINALMIAAAQGRYADILAYSNEPHASIDFNHNPHSAIVDTNHTQLAGPLANLLLWFDNEWGFSNRMLEVAALWARRIALHK